MAFQALGILVGLGICFLLIETVFEGHADQKMRWHEEYYARYEEEWNCAQKNFTEAQELLRKHYPEYKNEIDAAYSSIIGIIKVRTSRFPSTPDFDHNIQKNTMSFVCSRDTNPKVLPLWPNYSVKPHTASNF